MSEEQVKDPGGMPSDVGGANQMEEKAKGQNAVAFDTYQKSVTEKKALQGELSKVKEELEAIRLQQLEAEGDKDKLVESLRTQLAEKAGTYQKYTSAFKSHVIQNEFEKLALQQGVKDDKNLNALTKLADFSEIEIGEDLSVNREDLSYKMESLKKEYPMFFDKPAPKFVDGQPQPQNKTAGAKKDLSGMTTEEIIAQAESIGLKTFIP